ncbi:ATP-binding protein [Nisaea sp.]|uniref:ATP-binding protein n=1 Tax=Nisaea sp. TaxID=2024842 RepID=UPI0032F01BA3
MDAIWNALYDNGFMPHGYCLLWDPWLFWSHAASDAAIAISYFSIPAALVFFAIKRTDFEYRWILYLFGAFIVCCGLTHLFGIWTLWVPSYGAEGIVKIFTALVSVATAVLLWPLLPKVIALPSTGDLIRSNQELEREVSQRLIAQQELQTLYVELEQRVADRTAELEERNRELALATSRAREANEAKSRFLSMMSHEFRTPLHGIMSMAGLLKETDLDRNQRDYIQTVDRSSQALTSIVDDILDFAKADAGRLTLAPAPVDIVALCEDVVASIAPIAHGRGLDIATIFFDRFVPHVVADGARLRQVLTNLIGNAVRYTDEGSIIVSVGLSERNGSPILRMSVEDTGIGIPPEKIETVFERFTQVSEDDLDNVRGGTGLGLAISRRLVELMSGSIRVTSEVGIGSEFVISLPVELVPESESGFVGPEQVTIYGPDGATRKELSSILKISGTIVSTVPAGDPGSVLEPPSSGDAIVIVGLQEACSDLSRFAEFPGRLIVMLPVGAKPMASESLGLSASVTAEIRHYPIRLADLFAIFNPAQQVDAAMQPQREANAQSLRVLIVDDNEENRLVADRILSRDGHSVATAMSGQEAIDILAGDRFDLVLMDLRMPDMDGYTAARKIRAGGGRSRDVPIVAVSANVMPEVARKTEQAGMNGQLAKPFQPSDLRSLVARFAPAAAVPAPGVLPKMDLDAEYLQDIADSAGEDVLLRTVARFQEQAEPRLAAILAADTPDEIGELAHALAGAAGTVGLLRLCALCNAIELAVHDVDMPRANRCLGDLRFVMSDALAALSGYLGKREATH